MLLKPHSLPKLNAHNEKIANVHQVEAGEIWSCPQIPRKGSR